MKDPQSPNTTELWTDKAMNDAEMGAKVTEALDRLKMIATQYQTPQSSLYQKDPVRIQILEALNFILANKYGPDTKKGSSNWWDWEIGSPRSMMDVSFLMRDEMPAVMKQAVVKTIDRFVPKADYRLNSSLKETGANLIDKVSIVIKRAAFEGSSSRLEHAQSCMAPLFTYVTSGDGFYKDGSFIQHADGLTAAKAHRAPVTAEVLPTQSIGQIVLETVDLALCGRLAVSKSLFLCFKGHNISFEVLYPTGDVVNLLGLCHVQLFQPVDVHNFAGLLIDAVQNLRVDLIQVHSAFYLHSFRARETALNGVLRFVV